jgi:hypothetical protein
MQVPRLLFSGQYSLGAHLIADHDATVAPSGASVGAGTDVAAGHRGLLIGSGAETGVNWPQSRSELAEPALA